MSARSAPFTPKLTACRSSAIALALPADSTATSRWHDLGRRRAPRRCPQHAAEATVCRRPELWRAPLASALGCRPGGGWSDGPSSEVLKAGRPSGGGRRKRRSANGKGGGKSKGGKGASGRSCSLQRGSAPSAACRPGFGLPRAAAQRQVGLAGPGIGSALLSDKDAAFLRPRPRRLLPVPVQFASVRDWSVSRASTDHSCPLSLCSAHSAGGSYLIRHKQRLQLRLLHGFRTA